MVVFVEILGNGGFGGFFGFFGFDDVEFEVVGGVDGEVFGVGGKWGLIGEGVDGVFVGFGCGGG